MAVEQPFELEAMFSPDEFGAVGIFRWDSTELSVSGLFDDPSLSVTPASTSSSGYSPVHNAAAEITTQQPRFICPTHLAASIPKRAILEIDGQEWTISDKRTDGGLTQFFLHTY